MITKNELKTIGFSSVNETEYHDAFRFNWEYNIKNQELWFINDGLGEPEYIATISNLKDLVKTLNSIDAGFYEFLESLNS
jgi:hypothetical protein